MRHLQISNLSFIYPNSPEALFADLNLTFSLGWNGLVGANGSGKTTLLKLIAKKLSPTHGTISGNALVYYCEQKLDDVPEDFDAFSTAYDSRSFKIKNALKIEDAWLYRWENLSYGEKKRIQIAVALYAEPDVLLLDEPTNHLDIATKQTLIEALKGFHKTGILISHDRTFLDTLCSTTVIIKNHHLYKYKTPYSNAMLEFRKEREALTRQIEDHNQKIKQLQKAIQQQKEKVSRSDSRLSKKHIDPHDRDAKEKINLAKLTGKDKNDARRVHTLNSKYQQLDADKMKVAKEYKRGIAIEGGVRGKHASICLNGGDLRLSGEKVLHYPRLLIGGSDKIALVGDNGSGKSSFIKALITQLDRRELLYLPQEIDTDLAAELFETIRTLPNEKKGALFTFVTRLSSDPKPLLENTMPSPGELRKLLIAKALLDNIAAVILDEPTNHMDIDAITSLEEALNHYDGLLLVVSHDALFVRSVAKRMWRITREGEGVYRLKEGGQAPA